MARTIPSPGQAQLPESLLASPRMPIMSGGAPPSDGHIGDLGRALNLGHATGYAGVAYQGGWADGQMVEPGGAWVTRVDVRIPRISRAIKIMRMTVYGYSGAGAGLVRARAGGGAWSPSIALPVAPAAYHPVGPGVIFGVGAWVLDAHGDYADLEIQMQGDTHITSLMVAWSDVDPTGSYPGVGGALNAGVVDGYHPIDDDETAEGMPLSSRLLKAMSAGLTSIEQRVRPLLCMGGIAGTVGVDAHRWLGPYPHRRTLMVLAERRQIVIWIRATNTSLIDLPVAIAIGRSARDRHTVVVAAGSGTTTTKHSYTLPRGRRDRIPDGPEIYEAIVDISIHPRDAVADRCLEMVTAWDRRS